MPDGSIRFAAADETADPSTIPQGAARFRPSATTSQKPPGSDPFQFQGKEYRPGASQFWKTSPQGLQRLGKAERLVPRDLSISYLRKLDDFPVAPVNNLWQDVRNLVPVQPVADFVGGQDELGYVVQLGMRRNARFGTRRQVHIRNLEEQEGPLRNGAPEQIVADAVEQDHFARVQLVRARDSQNQCLLGLATLAVPVGDAPPDRHMLHNKAGSQ